MMQAPRFAETPSGAVPLAFGTTRRLRAPRALVWETCTRPEHLCRWLAGPEGWTMTVCEVDLRPGGGYRVVWRAPDGREAGLRGVYQEIVAPERLVSIERWDGCPLATLHTVHLREVDGGTALRSELLCLVERGAADAAA